VKPFSNFRRGCHVHVLAGEPHSCAFPELAHVLNAVGLITVCAGAARRRGRVRARRRPPRFSRFLYLDASTLVSRDAAAAGVRLFGTADSWAYGSDSLLALPPKWQS
jgi:hypothetical protein